MQPSSLVFLVIIAVWAAYFVQYWVRRREHLATARSVDQFSESMRVLERRSPLPASNLSTPQPRSYAVTPARVARPQVLVKRAETAPTLPAAATASTAPLVEDETTTPRTPSSARRTRAVIMLGALATVVVASTLVALALVPLAVLAVPVVAVGGALTWSRADAQAQRRARLAARRDSRPTSRASQPRSPEQAAADAAPVSAPVATSTPAAVEAEIADEVPTSGAVATRGELYDVQAVETSLRRPAAATAVAEPVAGASVAPPRPLVDEDDIPLTWDPVPVPRPTYTMKARVTRPAPTSADLVGDADTEYAAYEETPERRVAGA